VQLQWEGYAGYIEINGTQYELKQCHWHSPSEHTIDGQRFNMEAHMVHESSDGKIAVVGILYKLGRPDSFLSSVSIFRNPIMYKRITPNTSLSLFFFFF
jgi:carbonic anhydrase